MMSMTTPTFGGEPEGPQKVPQKGNENWDFAQERSQTFLLGAAINFGPWTFSDFTFIF